MDVFIDGFAYFSLFSYIIYDHLKCVSRLRATLYIGKNFLRANNAEMEAPASPVWLFCI